VACSYLKRWGDESNAELKEATTHKIPINTRFNRMGTRRKSKGEAGRRKKKSLRIIHSKACGGKVPGHIPRAHSSLLLLSENETARLNCMKGRGTLSYERVVFDTQKETKKKTRKEGRENGEAGDERYDITVGASGLLPR